MTRLSQKKRERFFVEEAAKLLGKKWCLGLDRERPDFIVTEGKQQFGLEVSELFTGKQDKSGSHMKEMESNTQDAVENLRKKYEQKEGTPLNVRFNGDMCDENMAEVLPALVALNLSTKAVLNSKIIEVNKGIAPLLVRVIRAPTAHWYSMNHRVGWVDTKPIDRITKAIKKKSKSLPIYKRNTGLSDIRLLIVADRTKNSGKLSLQECPAFDLREFNVAYFFSYPEDVQILNSSR